MMEDVLHPFGEGLRVMSWKVEGWKVVEGWKG